MGGHPEHRRAGRRERCRRPARPAGTAVHGRPAGTSSDPAGSSSKSAGSSSNKAAWGSREAGRGRAGSRPPGSWRLVETRGGHTAAVRRASSAQRTPPTGGVQAGRPGRSGRRRGRPARRGPRVARGQPWAQLYGPARPATGPASGLARPAAERTCGLARPAAGRARVRAGHVRVLGCEGGRVRLVIPEVRCLERIRHRTRRGRGGVREGPLRGGEQRGQVYERSPIRYRPAKGPGVP